jgi:monothiol glutaredoxin
MTIKAYLKPSCGWSNGVRAILQKYRLEYEDIDIIGNRENYAEMVRKSGQPLSPCVEIDGVMLADISGEEVENYLLSNDLVQPTGTSAGAPTNAGCSDAEEYAKMATKTVRFF